MTTFLAWIGGIAGILLIAAIIGFLFLDWLACGMGAPSGLFC